MYRPYTYLNWLSWLYPHRLGEVKSHFSDFSDGEQKIKKTAATAYLSTEPNPDHISPFMSFCRPAASHVPAHISPSHASPILRRQGQRRGWRGKASLALQKWLRVTQHCGRLTVTVRRDSTLDYTARNTNRTRRRPDSSSRGGGRFCHGGVYHHGSSGEGVSDSSSPEAKDNNAAWRA